MSASTGSRFRPLLETCEAREVPAALTWTNAFGNSDFYTAANWVLTGTSITAPSAPVMGDDVTFDGGVSSANCLNLGPLLTTVSDPDAPSPYPGLNSLRLINSYAGTVSLVASLRVRTFTLSAASTGALAQPVSTLGSDLTVTDAFTWTSGTLNSSINLATVNISGNGDITPVAAGTLSFGSALNFAASQPKETEIKPGTLVAQNAAALTIVAYYSVKAKVLAEGDVVTITVPAPANAPVGQLTIQAGGKLNLIGPGTYNTNYYVENSGELNLTGLVRAHFTNPEGGFQYGQIDNGKLGMENGTHLYAKSKIEGGLVFLTMNPNLAANDQTATIHGYVVVSGGLILFAAPIGIGTAPYVYGTFTVDGNVDWLGGTFKLSVDYTSVGLANKWIVTGKMTSASTAKIEPNPQRGPNRPAGSNWQILLAGDTAGNLPTITGNTGLNLTAGTAGLQKAWSLLSPPN